MLYVNTTQYRTLFQTIKNKNNCKTYVIHFGLFMVARSSDSESKATIIIYRCFLFIFFLSPHFLKRRKTDILETFPHDVD